MNYPPGVSGNEYEIAGPEYMQEVDEPCPKCGVLSLMELGYRSSHWIDCMNCDYESDIESIEDERGL